MNSRRDRVLAHLDEAVVHEGSVADLAADMNDPSPNSVSATVSLLIKEGVIRRSPDLPGAVAEWLWLAKNDESAQRVLAGTPDRLAPLIDTPRSPSADIVEEPEPDEKPRPEDDEPEPTLDPALGTIVDGQRRCPDGVDCAVDCEAECMRVLDGAKPVGADRWPNRVLEAHDLLVDVTIEAFDDVAERVITALDVPFDLVVGPLDRPCPGPDVDEWLATQRQGDLREAGLLAERIERMRPASRTWSPLSVTLDIASRSVYVEGTALTDEEARTLIGDLEAALRARAAL